MLLLAALLALSSPVSAGDPGVPGDVAAADLLSRMEKFEKLGGKGLVPIFIVGSYCRNDGKREMAVAWRRLFEKLEGIQVLKSLGTERPDDSPWMCWIRQLTQFESLSYYRVKLFFKVKDAKGRVQISTMPISVMVPTVYQVEEKGYLRTSWFGTAGEICYVSSDYWHDYAGILGKPWKLGDARVPDCKKGELRKAPSPFTPQVCDESAPPK